MYKIAVLLDAYQPDIQGDEQPVIREETYDTIDEARAIVDAEMDEPLYYEHNIYGRTLYVIDDVTADYITGGRNADGSNYDWDNNACRRDDGEACGECNECIRMMIDQDREYIKTSAVYHRP